jgi:exosortase
MMRHKAVLATAIAMLACYAPVIQGMAHQWLTDEDMGHGFLVPLVVAWIIGKDRSRWNSLAVKPSLWGWAFLAGGASLQFVGAVGGGLFAGSLALLLSICGAVLILGGTAWLRAWAFPLLLALFALPKLAIVYNQTTLPLQLLASRMAAGFLTIAGVGVIREGNILDVAGHRISVVEACDGIRYLLPLAFMALVFGYVTGSKPWLRGVLLVTAVPIALVANAVRVAAAGYWPALAGGTPHTASGWVIFVACLAVLVPVHRFLDALEDRRHA